MKSIILSYSDVGGAGRAAVNICKSLQKSQIKTELYVKRKISNSNFIKSFYKKSLFDFENFKEKINRNFCKLGKKKTYSYQSPSLFPTKVSKILNTSDFDIVHLCWINEFLSIEDIGKIKKPVIWSFCDMWPFSGINHYDEYNGEIFWRKNNFEKLIKFSLDKWIIRRKIKSWKLPMNIVVPNKWMYDCVKDSKIMSDFNCEIIKWPIDDSIFYSKNKIDFKMKFNFDPKKKLVLFACSNGLKDRRKGWDYLNSSLNMVKQKFDLVILGAKENIQINKNFNGKIYWIEKINNDEQLSNLYNSVDCLALPSRHDNSPLISLEAQCCGLPIVLFDCNGMSDLVDHKISGFKAEAYNVEHFAEGIDWCIINSDQDILKKNILIKSKEQNMKSIGIKYLKLYNKIIYK